ncbi:G1 family glutamic endopeptidase [Paenibacillus sp.]|jgi:hypothetical protein|uniref:G1 family glutamic endopeptidase n=1 Tax=Paenibacillus sp. TaxID=58172 RepID=UPI00281EE9F5|nr:G1 family glutamic endopeptidase [Paenibacillus sp.]MDR0271534.1 hypothetical protein [Paenibacillus sp.]
MNRLNRICIVKNSNIKHSSNLGWVSTNWSGYAISGQKNDFRKISANWTVPFVRSSSQNSYSSVWIGIDGFRNSSLIQTGTGHDFIDGKANYYAWWEILPQAMTLIPKPVHPGDHMKAVISKVTGSTWLISLRNTSRNWVFRIIKRYSGPQTSAEWIVEAPQVGASITRLARISNVYFTGCRLNGKSPNLTTVNRGNMMQSSSATSIPGKPNAAGDAFVVTNQIGRASGPVRKLTRP